MVLTASRASSLPLLCSLDVCSSGRMKSSAVDGSPGYRDTRSCSSGTPDTCKDETSPHAGIPLGRLPLNFVQ